MDKPLLLLLCCLQFLPAAAQKTPFEQSDGNETATYGQVISWFNMLDQKYEQAKLVQAGSTDSGEPLHLFILSENGNFEPGGDRPVLLINNGIHPGEPEGIDATMMLSRDMLEKNSLPENLVICIIPVYNVGGALNRNSYSRANQNGPRSYGFRGNSRNLDLNRDFIKTDSKNSQSFQQIFQRWKPHVFIDNHTTNGADYQHVITYIASQKDKLHPALAAYMTGSLNPVLDRILTDSCFPPVPYVHFRETTPESGLIGFYDSPRYSTGYSALFNTIGYVLETHMLKPYEQRVRASYVFMEELIAILERDHQALLEAKSLADQKVKEQEEFTLHWRLDTTSFDTIEFRGYKASYKKSELSGKPRLYYDTSHPYTKQIGFYNDYRPVITVGRPKAYLVPQSWSRAIELLKLNGVTLQQLERDTEMEAEVYYIEDYKTVKTPYEGHYLHYDMQVRKEKQQVKCYKGDYLVHTNQPSVRYIMEVLEPQAPDSYFAWNFFDSILGQKEYFSAYVFEDLAADLLKADKELKQQLEDKKKHDPEFAKNGAAQLDFIYRRSPYYEKSHLRYPIFRVN
ncbi:zinc carboxypeptidase [Anseongella ginsenosidimutans]|uniref:Zinc carboxypeptidase n=1 Tax=Anseongella ginsenosidimutans TaxID=496056 RepID=A0A4R3KUW4_9SPHI|nr:M14 family metallopeptidase [Anseongella ginsenosidimutans]QEC51732.1 hypothetical protein FRZ59_04855 [Anseongella ginsenosidimutans]TCS89095.1 zinc carboxypeptidase [Anseongella ginsenosidimutans]